MSVMPAGKGIEKKIKKAEKNIKKLERTIKSSKATISRHAGVIKKKQSKLIDEYGDNQLQTYAQNYYQSIANLKQGDMHGDAGAPNVLKHRVDIRDEFLDYLYFMYHVSMTESYI